MFWPYKFCTDDKKLLSFTTRVFNKSWWSAKFVGYIMWTCCILFFGNYPSLNRVFMCCRWLKKPRFNDVCVLSKHSNFAPECWKCILRGPGFKIFPETGNFRLASRAFAASFFLLYLLQSFCHLLKILLKNPVLLLAFLFAEELKTLQQ